MLKKIPPFNNIPSVILTVLLDGDHEIGPNDMGIFRTLVVICIGVGLNVPLSYSKVAQCATYCLE